MTRTVSSLIFPAAALLLTAWSLVGCASSLGPGYTVVSQQIRVTFESQPSPRILVDAEYRLRNVGNQNLDILDVRLPGRRFSTAGTVISWDGNVISPSESSTNPRDTLLRFPERWMIGASHILHFTYAISSTPDADDDIGISHDAFYLPAEAWTPQLPQPRGVFGFGGIPPSKWELSVQVPSEFLVHASGAKPKQNRKNGQIRFVFRQSSADLAPFVVAGHYREAWQQLFQSQDIHIWSRGELDQATLQREGESLSRSLAVYDSLFGGRGKSRPPLWIVECPAEFGCRARRDTGYSKILFGDEPAASSEMISQDTALVLPPVSGQNPETFAAPALAAGWLGYGQNPGFYEQQLPMSVLPAFAAAQAREIAAGPGVREQIIRRALAQVPVDATAASNSDARIFRAKSFLLFYALHDRIGADRFRDAMQHMLSARRSRGFDVTDLISAIEQESHQPIGPFVRQWIKHPGVPAEFRAKYSVTSGAKNALVQEATP